MPGPPEPLYFNGSRLESLFPLSLLLQGNALNITCVSYAGTLNFGFTGARDTLPHLQHLAIFMGEALEELDRLLLGPRRQSQSQSQTAAAHGGAGRRLQRGSRSRTRGRARGCDASRSTGLCARRDAIRRGACAGPRRTTRRPPPTPASRR